MSDSNSPELGPDQAFAARAREHSTLTSAAENRLEAAARVLANKGEVPNEVEEYAKALAELTGLRVYGRLLIAASRSLDPSQSEVLFGEYEHTEIEKLKENKNSQ